MSTYHKKKKTMTKRRKGGMFGVDVRGKMAEAMGKPADAFKPADMGLMKKADELSSKASTAMHSAYDSMKAKMGPAPAPVRGGKKYKKKTMKKHKKTMKKSKKAKKSKKSKKTKKMFFGLF